MPDPSENDLTLYVARQDLDALSITSIDAQDAHSYSKEQLKQLVSDDAVRQEYIGMLRSNVKEKTKEFSDRSEQSFMESYLGIHQQRALDSTQVKKDFERTGGAAIVLDGTEHQYTSSSYESFEKNLKETAIKNQLDQSIIDYIQLFSHQSGFLFDGQNYLMRQVQGQIYESTSKTEDNPKKWAQAAVYYGQKINLNYMERDPSSTKYEINSSDPSVCIVKTKMHTDYLSMQYAISAKESETVNIPCNFSIETEHELKSDSDKVTKTLKEIKITFESLADKEIFEKYFAQAANLTELRQHDTELRTKYNLMVKGDPAIMQDLSSTEGPIDCKIFVPEDEEDDPIARFNQALRDKLDDEAYEKSPKGCSDEQLTLTTIELDTWQRSANQDQIQKDFTRSAGAVIILNGEKLQFKTTEENEQNTGFNDRTFQDFNLKLKELSESSRLEKGIVDYINTFAHQGGFLYDSQTYLLRLNTKQIMSTNPQTPEDWKLAINLYQLKSNASIASSFLPTYIIDDKNTCRVQTTMQAQHLKILAYDENGDRKEEKIPCRFSIQTEHLLTFDEASNTVDKKLNSLKIKFETPEDKALFEKVYGKVETLKDLEKLNKELINPQGNPALKSEKSSKLIDTIANVFLTVAKVLAFPFLMISKAWSSRNSVAPEAYEPIKKEPSAFVTKEPNSKQSITTTGPQELNIREGSNLTSSLYSSSVEVDKDVAKRKRNSLSGG